MKEILNNLRIAKRAMDPVLCDELAYTWKKSIAETDFCHPNMRFQPGFDVTHSKEMETIEIARKYRR